MSVQERIDSLLLLTPFPDELMKSEEVNLYYQDLELTGGNYLESILNVSLFKMRNIRRGFSSDKDKWRIIGIAEDITEIDRLNLNAIVYSKRIHFFFFDYRKNYFQRLFSRGLSFKDLFSEGLFFGYSFSSKGFYL